MRYYLAAIPLVILTSCAEVGSNSGDAVQQVVDGTRELCSFVPLTTSVLALLGAPVAPAAGTLVTSICDEAKKLTDAGFVAPGTQATLIVNGQPVVGQFVN
jgi:hypothetical protein